jgi:hypothetical protein
MLACVLRAGVVARARLTGALVLDRDGRDDLERLFRLVARLRVRVAV